MPAICEAYVKGRTALTLRGEGIVPFHVRIVLIPVESAFIRRKGTSMPDFAETADRTEVTDNRSDVTNDRPAGTTDRSAGTTNRLAAINIGSNSIKMLIIDATPWPIVLDKRMKITKLAEGLEESGILKPEAMARSLDVVEEFHSLAKRMSCRNIRITATAAARSALNSGEFRRLVSERTGEELSVISGEEEARLSYLGAVWGSGLYAAKGSNAKVSNFKASSLSIVMDIGGASTELVIGADNSVSIDMGAVRILENFYRHDPPLESELRAAEEHIAGVAGEAVKRIEEKYAELRAEREADPGSGLCVPQIQVIGVGGVFTTMASLEMGLLEYDPKLVNGYSLAIDDVRRLYRKMSGLKKKQRMAAPGMIPPERGEVIVGGLAIAERLMSILGADSATVSEAGILEGMIYDMMRYASCQDMRTAKTRDMTNGMIT